MAVAGIIAEYNPFHRGHAWQIQEVRRRLGADTAVVACMSGNFVQRGDFAILAKHPRAEAALAGGVDLVLELPTPWSAATAERFAWGAVFILSALGCVDTLAFGSECGELPPLERCAAALREPRLDKELRRRMGEGLSYAAARQQGVEALYGPEAAVPLARPNDTLAVQYLVELAKVGGSIRPFTIPRQGAGHDSASPCGGEGERPPTASAPPWTTSWPPSGTGGSPCAGS